MNRHTFLTRTGLGFLATLFARSASATTKPLPGAPDGVTARALTRLDELIDAVPAEPVAPFWRKDGDWTVVHAPVSVDAGEMFLPHLHIPDCPEIVAPGFECVLVANGEEIEYAMEADAGLDRVRVFTHMGPFGEMGIATQDRPFFLFWPEQWVVLVSAGAIDQPIPFKYSTGPGRGRELSRYKIGITTEWTTGAVVERPRLYPHATSIRRP